MQFICLQPIDSRKDVGIPVHRVDAIAFGRSDEGKMDRYGLAAFIGASKEAVLSDENPAFDRSLCFVIVNGNVGILEEPGKGSPVFESVANGFHQVMRWVEAAFRLDDDFAQELYQGFRFSAAHGQSKSGWFVFDLPFDLVQFPVNIENDRSNVVFGKARFEVSSPGVSAAASFGSLLVIEQSVESTGCICLDNSAKVLKELKIFAKGQIGRVVEESNFAAIVADVGSDFPFAHVPFMAPVLNLDGGVICFDDARFEQFFLEHGIQQGKGIGGILHPIALRGARDSDVLASENLLLAVIGQAVIELADNDLGEQAWSCVAPGDRRAGLFSGDNVLFALWTGASFLHVVEDFQARAHHFKLVGEQMSDMLCLDRACRTNRIFRFDLMWNRFMLQACCVIEDMLDAGSLVGPIGSLGRAIRGLLLFGCSRSWVVSFCFCPVFFFVSLFRLCNQNIELGLKIFKQSAQLFLSVERLFQLSL
ncbi:MAG: hypothetical protein QG574_4562 [Cyanobacteriota bacterium erpe_2018_sw_21hr_WHONDRS-SW48-000092_B_bin.40]|nr:hypothetical protein [Cyanobacteriota bacterium erpe_2018_sw_21hr_WHONDRS-SW48-000092_B_bin.40]